APDLARPAAHRDEAEAGVRGVFGPGRAAEGRAAAGRAAEGRAAVRPAPEAAAVVADLELEVAPRQRRRPGVARRVDDPHAHGATARAGVLDDVGERLLDDVVGGQLDGGWHRAEVVGLEGEGRAPGRAQRLDPLPYRAHPAKERELGRVQPV